MLLAAIMDELELMEFHLIHDSSKQQYWLTMPEAVCTVRCSSAHHQEHTLLLAAIVDELELTDFHLIHDSSKEQYWLTIPEAVSTVMCS